MRSVPRMAFSFPAARSGRSTRFIFSVEGDGSLPILGVLSTAVENIQKKATDLETILSDVSGRETK